MEPDGKRCAGCRGCRPAPFNCWFHCLADFSEVNTMSRCLYVLLALLLASTALAAPVPEVFVSDWGSPVDPDKDCKIRREKGALTIEIPGTPHEYDLRCKRVNAP